jgi:DNA-binding NarL/FixJ family response regulator
VAAYDFGRLRRGYVGAVNVRVLIADDDPVMRMLMGAALSRDPEMQLAGEAEDAPTAIAAAERLRPDVALLDIEMPGGGGPQAAREIRAKSPETRVLALSAHQTDAARAEMTAAGAIGYVVKGAPPEEVLRAIREAVRQP